jgi:tetratricopeptide (TPR) repeat protein
MSILRNSGSTVSWPAAVALTLLALAPVSLGFGQEYSEDELRVLPRACLAQKFISEDLRVPVVPEAERKQWAASLGPSYEHYHHFCWGLIDLRRANGSRSPRDRQHNYLRAISNFRYVQNNATRDFPLLPEVFLRKGQALRHVEDEGGAAREFLGAIQLKRNYTPAYAALIDVYLDLQDVDKAEQTLNQGLAVAPDSKILASKKAEIEQRRAARH